MRATSVAACATPTYRGASSSVATSRCVGHVTRQASDHYDRVKFNPHNTMSSVMRKMFNMPIRHRDEYLSFTTTGTYSIAARRRRRSSRLLWLVLHCSVPSRRVVRRHLRHLLDELHQEQPHDAAVDRLVGLSTVASSLFAHLRSLFFHLCCNTTVSSRDTFLFLMKTFSLREFLKFFCKHLIGYRVIYFIRLLQCN